MVMIVLVVIVLMVEVEVEVEALALFMPEAPHKGSQLDEETFCSDTTASSGLLPPTMGKVSGCVPSSYAVQHVEHECSHAAEQWRALSVASAKMPRNAAVLASALSSVARVLDSSAWTVCSRFH